MIHPLQELRTQLLVFCKALYGGFLPPTALFLDWMCHTHDERVNMCLDRVSLSGEGGLKGLKGGEDMLVGFVKGMVPLLVRWRGVHASE